MIRISRQIQGKTLKNPPPVKGKIIKKDSSEDNSKITEINQTIVKEKNTSDIETEDIIKVKNTDYWIPDMGIKDFAKFKRKNSIKPLKFYYFQIISSCFIILFSGFAAIIALLNTNIESSILFSSILVMDIIYLAILYYLFDWGYYFLQIYLISTGISIALSHSLSYWYSLDMVYDPYISSGLLFMYSLIGVGITYLFLIYYHKRRYLFDSFQQRIELAEQYRNYTLPPKKIQERILIAVSYIGLFYIVLLNILQLSLFTNYIYGSDSLFTYILAIAISIPLTNMICFKVFYKCPQDKKLLFIGSTISVLCGFYDIAISMWHYLSSYIIIFIILLLAYNIISVILVMRLTPKIFSYLRKFNIL